jgi:hypothetical protein
VNWMKSEKQWLERNRYYSTLDESKLTSIFYFPIIWNLFEKNCCEGNAQINTHAPKLANLYTEKIMEVLPSIWKHFQERYVQDGNTTEIFDEFEFRPTDQKEKVKVALLTNRILPSSDKVEALLRIGFRLRNNLFHGEKDIRKLYEQNENFKQINILLMALLDANRN